MQESDEDGVAAHFDVDPRAESGDSLGVASGTGTARPAIKLRSRDIRVPRLLCSEEGHTSLRA